MTSDQLLKLQAFDHICHLVDCQLYQVVSVSWPKPSYSLAEVTIRCASKIGPSKTVLGRELLKKDWGLASVTITKELLPMPPLTDIKL